MEWIALASAVIGAVGGTSKPATPSMSSSNPVYAGLFDSSGWSMNFGGTQTATSSPSNSASPVVSAPGQSAATAPAGIDTNLMLMAGGVILLALWLR